MKKCKLKDVATLIAGFPFDGHKYSSEGIRVVRGDNVTIGRLRWDIDKRWNYPFKEAQTYLLRNEDIVIGMDGSRVGRNRAFVSECDLPLYLAQRVACVRHNEKSIQKYLYYAIFSDRFEQYINTIHTGTSIPHISLEQLGDFEFLIPSITEQEKIGNLLYDIDQKISLNTRINAELEAMAKQLYDYWFVQFDFPDENGKPYKSSGGKMVWNEKLKREIPEGWEVKEMGDMLNFSNGINYEKDIAGDKKYRIINVRNITSSSIFINKDDLDIIELPSKQANNYLITEDDIIIARSGTPGSTRLIMNPYDVIYCGFIIKGTPRNNNNKYILMYYLKQLEGTQATKTGGSILQNVSQDTLKSLRMIVPPENIVNTFNQFVDKIFNSINSNIETSNHLTHLRDSLLPMLMNGQVTIE